MYGILSWNDQQGDGCQDNRMAFVKNNIQNILATRFFKGVTDTI
jgi:hypothetical protein